MTQAEMYLKLARNHKLKFVQVKSIVDNFFEMMRDELLAGGHVQIHKFGTFDIGTIKERNGYNLLTGEPLQIPETKRVRFKQSRNIRDKLRAR